VCVREREMLKIVGRARNDHLHTYVLNDLPEKGLTETNTPTYLTQTSMVRTISFITITLRDFLTHFRKFDRFCSYFYIHTYLLN